MAKRLEKRRSRLPLEHAYKITQEDIHQLAEDAGQVARWFLEIEAENAKQLGYQIGANDIDQRVKLIERKVADHLSSHLQGEFDKFHREVLLLFSFEQKRSALVAMLKAEGGDSAMLRLVQKIFAEDEKKVDRLVFAARRSVPKGAPLGKRKTTREQEHVVRRLFAEMKELAKMQGKRIGKNAILPAIAERVGLSEHTVDSLLWPRQRKKKPRD